MENTIRINDEFEIFQYVENNEAKFNHHLELNCPIFAPIDIICPSITTNNYLNCTSIRTVDASLQNVVCNKIIAIDLKAREIDCKEFDVSRSLVHNIRTNHIEGVSILAKNISTNTIDMPYILFSKECVIRNKENSKTKHIKRIGE